MAKVTKLHPSLRGANLVTKYGFPEGSCVIPKKAAYMYDEAWSKVVKMVAPGIIKMKLINVAFFALFILYISNSPSVYPQIIFIWFVIPQSGGN